jgi:hypothetical protein
MTTAPQHTPPHRSRSRWLMFGIPLLATAGGAIVVVGLYFVSVSTVKTLPVTARDRESLMTATDLQGVIPGLVMRTDAETLTKVRAHNGRVELAYVYDHPDEKSPLLLTCSIIVEPTRNDARLSYAERLAGAPDAAAMLESGLILEQRDGVYQWGDVSSFAEVTKLGQPRGFFYACRLGERVFCVQLFSRNPPSQEKFLEMLAPYLERLASYEP